MTESTSPEKNIFGSVVRVVLKAALLFVAINLLWALSNPLPALARLSLYNTVVPGRTRLPFGENPEQAYNFSTFQLDTMFASHHIPRQKKTDEYRVVLIGDSSTWGFLLRPEETYAGQLNGMNLQTSDGRNIQAYNFGYPTISVTKDLMILDRVLGYDPDLVIWLTTLEAMPANKQLSSPIVQNNPQAVRPLLDRYDLSIAPGDADFVEQTFWDRTIIGERREISDVLRLNLYGVMWAGTGIDQVYPDFEPRQEDFEEDVSFYGLEQPLTRDDIAEEVLAAGVEMAEGQGVQLLIVNEPTFVSMGDNSDIRYNFFYPRWAYDTYRQIMAEEAAERGWLYADLWRAVDDSQYTNSAIHLTPEGANQLSQALAQEIEVILR